MPKNAAIHHKKRRGQHHKHGPRYLKTYLPYLPLVVSLAISLMLGSLSPSNAHTLAYATNMSIGGLLQSTNSQRESNSQADLTLNQKLINAAQAKANDMVARNYWSHNTPDGQEPWVFMSNAGYNYQKAGENLAYGFTTYNDTVTGWMNSPSHRANLLDGSFTEVGFGYANGNNYNNSGQETVVVAMYGKPQTLGASTPAAAQAAPAPQAPTAKQSAPVAQSQPANPAASPSADTPLASPSSTVAVTKSKPVNSDWPVVDTSSAGLQPVTRLQTLSPNPTPWVSATLSLLTGLAILLILIKHSLALRHVIRHNEKLLLRHLHHPLSDSVMLGIIIVAFALTRTAGFIV